MSNKKNRNKPKPNPPQTPIPFKGWIVQPPIEALYKRLVKSFVDDDKAFETFKRNPQYSSIIGVPTIEQMFRFYTNLKDDGELYVKLPELAKMDTIGGPWLYPFDGMKYSANLIRYVDSLRLIRKHIGSLDGKRVLEFGSGFGGFFWVSSCIWKMTSYNIVDLTEAEDLAIKHSKALGLELKRGKPEAWDITIAEYSLTEQVGDDLWKYTAEYLEPVKTFWVRCNIFNDAVREKWIQHLRNTHGLTIMRENPDIVKQNSIVIGQRAD